MKSALTRSTLRLLESDEPVRSIESDVTEHLSDFSALASELGDAVLGKQNKALRQLDTDGVLNVMEMVSRVSEQPARLSNVTIRTVFGATEKMPFRALEYVLPSLQLAKQLSAAFENSRSTQESPLPLIELLCMLQAGVDINQLNSELVYYESALFQTLAHAFTQEFFPAQNRALQLKDDQSLTPMILANPAYAKAVEKLSEHIEEIPLFEGLIHRKANGQLNTALHYAALHYFVHDLVEDDSSTELLLSMGGHTEKIFFDVRSKLLGLPVADMKPVRTAQYITHHQAPAYQPIDGDLFLDEVLERPEVLRAVHQASFGTSEYARPVVQAVQHLVEVTGSVYTLIEFVASQRGSV